MPGCARSSGRADIFASTVRFAMPAQYTSPSNAAFDQSLRARDPDSGIRDFEAVDELARQQGLLLVADHAMPANNQLLVWQRERG